MTDKVRAARIQAPSPSSPVFRQFRLWRLHHLVRICSRGAYGSLSDEQDLRHS